MHYVAEYLDIRSSLEHNRVYLHGNISRIIRLSCSLCQLPMSILLVYITIPNITAQFTPPFSQSRAYLYFRTALVDLLLLAI